MLTLDEEGKKRDANGHILITQAIYKESKNENELNVWKLKFFKFE